MTVIQGHERFKRRLWGHAIILSDEWNWSTLAGLQIIDYKL